MLSLVIPVYNNAESLPRLFAAIEGIRRDLPGAFEVVFVIDGPSDGSGDIISAHAAQWTIPTQVVRLSRNFGSFPAVSAGLLHARGTHMAVMAADLQEPPELILEFHRRLASGEADVVFGQRVSRADPWLSRMASDLYWGLYRRIVSQDMPRGGVDVFGCSAAVRDHLRSLPEASTNLVGLLFWVGYRRAFVPYTRVARQEGRSGWTISRKIRHALDSIFSFTDWPIRLLLWVGLIGTVAPIIASAIVIAGWAAGRIPVLGYTPLMLAILFFGGLTTLGLGIVGQYLWLTLANTRRRPTFIVSTIEQQDRHE